MKRLGVLVVAFIAIAAAPAAAGGYPPDDNIITVSDATPCPGKAFTIDAKTFQPGATVTVTLLPDAVLGTPTADENGSVTLDVTLSATQALGKQTIQASGPGADDSERSLTLTSTIEVVSCDATTPTTATPPTTVGGGDNGLPKTGSNDALPLLKIGGGLAGLGGVLIALAAARKRRSGQPA
jgi:hypothetical protein